MAGKSELDRIQSGRDGKVWVEYVDDVAVIRMGCGENRFNNHFLDGVNRCLDEILQRSDVNAVVTVGEGKFFSNGLDLNWLKSLAGSSREDVAAFIKRWHTTLKRILLLPLPTVAAINGHAYAGGAFLTLAHDYRVMQTGRGWWSINEVHLGLKIPKWLIAMTTFKIPGSKAQSDVIIFGKRFTASEALSQGIVQRTTSSETLIQEAVKVAKDAYKGTALQRESIQMMKEDTFEEFLKFFEDTPHRSYL